MYKNQQARNMPFSKKHWEFIIQYLSKFDYKTDKFYKILEVGCGSGKLYHFIRESIPDLKIDYFGLDINPAVKEKIQSIGKFVYVDFTEENPKVPFESNSFDFVILSEIIEHVEYTDNLIINTKNYLRKDGILFITTPNLSSYHSRISLLFGYMPMIMECSDREASFGKPKWLCKEWYGRYKNIAPIHHIRFFTYKAISDFLKYYGFEIVKQSGGGYRKGEGILWRIFPSFSPVIQLICRKR